MAIKINAAPASSNNSYTFSENGGVNASLNVRANDGKSSTRPLHSLDDGQVADLGTADPVSNAGTTPDRSALGAAIWINPDGTVGYSTAPIAAQVENLAPGETLQDSFLYATRQQNGSLLWSTVRITITGTNDAPVARADVADLVEDAPATGSAATNDSDVDNGAVLSFAATSSAAGFSMAADGSWTLDTSHEAYQDLAAGEDRQIVVTYKVTDQYGASAASTLTVTVTGTNDAPVAAAATAAALEDGILSGRVAATDVDRGDSLTYALVGEAPPGRAFAADGSWSFDAGNAAYQGLGTGETRELVVNYSATDGAGASGMSTLTITVTGANDAPVALAADAAVTEDGIVTGQLAASDADDSAALTYTVAKGAPEGFVLAADGSWAFDANQAGLQGLAEGESAGIAVTYRVTDEHGASSLSTLVLTVTGANDAPVATSHAAEVTEGGTVSGQLTSIDQDNGAELSFAIVGDAPAGLVLAADGSWTFDAANQAYRGLAAGEIRIVEVPFAVTDEHGATASSFMVIAVTGTDDAPVLAGTPPELPAGTEDTAYTVTQEQLLAGWVDPDGSSLVASGLTAANATVTANADGSFTITPGAEFSGELQLSYEVTDGFRVSPASAQLTIAAVDDPATDFTGTMSGSLWEDVQATSISGDVNFTDRDGAADQWQPVTSTTRTESGFGFFTVAANGTWTYTLDNSHAAVDSLGGGQSLTDSFVIRTLDGTEQMITVLIKGRTDISYVAPGVSVDADSWDNDDMFVGYEWSWARTYTAGPYDDQVQGSNFADTIQGGDGWDRIYGHDGNDLLYGDLASGTASWADDRVFGQRGDDTIYGGVGSDTLYGGSGDDIIYANGSATADRYESDVLFGGSGNDRLYGSANHDRFTGGTGADWLVGGGGSDWFQFQSATHTGDTIADFEQGRDLIVIESLRLDKANFLGALASPGQVEAGQVGYFVADGQTTIYIDADGVPGADLEITLVGSYALNASDFMWA